MYRRIYILLTLLLSVQLLCSQSAKQADDLFGAQQYAEARKVYDALLRRQPTHPLYLYRAARCAQETGDLAAAEALFVKAGTKYPLRDFFLGEIYYQQWRMTEAIASYEAFLQSIDEQSERREHVQQRLSSAQLIARYLKHVSRVEVLGVNRVSLSRMLTAYPLSEDNGSLRLDSLGSCYTTQRGDRRFYSVSDSVTIDSVTTTRTVIVSQQRLLQHWEAPDTLSEAVNSGTANRYPFVLTDGATLYFASDREGGLGGLDIYMTRYNAALGEWLPAENIGLPYNSPADDYLFATDEAAGVAFFATNRHCEDTDSVEVYKIALGDRTFLRGLPDQELVALARLDSLLPLMANDEQLFAETEDKPAATGQPAGRPTSSATKHQASNDSIYLVISDSEVYTHMTDFRSDSARTLYREYIRLEQTQSQAVQMLDSLRQQYYHANDATRASLQARIPILSDEISERKRTLRETLSQVRALESAQ